MGFIYSPQKNTMKSTLANLGFVMQISGIFITIPIILSLVNDEIPATIGFFTTATIYFTMGFLLNALCERKELNFKQSSTLFVLVFISLSIIGSIPYLYVNFTNSDIAGTITDSIFESTSGFTTTGFSMISDVTQQSQSIIFYRALTQFIGGIGIVLILLVFFYPEEKLREFSKSFGFFQDKIKIKKSFILILLIYSIYCLFIIVITFFLGYQDIFSLVCFTFSALSTGGFSPINDITSIVSNAPLGYMLMIGMILGAANFLAMASFFRLKKSYFKIFIKSEIPAYIIMIIGVIIVVTVFYQLSLFDTAFHIISAATNCGFSFLNLASFPTDLKYYLSILMFIGGTSISTAGGIKLFRFYLVFKAINATVIENITQTTHNVTLFGKEYTRSEVLQALIVVILMGIAVLLASLFFTSHGYALSDSIFETTSAVATTGLSVGIANVNLALELKWVLIALMLFGRVEALPFLIMLSRKHQKTH